MYKVYWYPILMLSSVDEAMKFIGNIFLLFDSAKKIDLEYINNCGVYLLIDASTLSIFKTYHHPRLFSVKTNAN